MNEKQRFVVIGWNADRQLFAFGTLTGKPFGSLTRANQVAEQVYQQYPNLNGAVALELHGFTRRKS